MADRDIDALAGSTSGELRTPAFAEWAGGDVVTLAIAFTDLVGSTALNEDIKDEPMNAVRQAHFTQSRKLIAQHGGREIKTIGDAFMVVFRSVDRALDYALTLQATPGHRELKDRVRAGLHIGRILVDEGDVFGREVNFAARVVGAIKGAEIWLSAPAMHDIDKLGAHRFADLRWELHDVASLKGFEGTYRLWSLLGADSPASAEVSNAPAFFAHSGSRPARSGVVESSSRREFDARAQNYDRVDLVSATEVVIDQHQDGKDRGLYAQVDFVERLYVESPRARVDSACAALLSRSQLMGRARSCGRITFASQLPGVMRNL
jgi:class 3 adenylate cyclase